MLTQVHATSPQGAIQRIIDVQPEENAEVFRKYFARTLRAVSVQTLLPRATGKGRVAAFGVLEIDAEMQDAIAEGRDIFNRKTPLPDGCRTIAEDLDRLVEEGTITAEARDAALVEMR